MNEDEVTVTRKYQITIPKRIRKSFGVRIGEKLRIKGRGKEIVIEGARHLEDPAEHLWSLSKKPAGVDAVRIIKEARKKVVP